MPDRKSILQFPVSRVEISHVALPQQLPAQHGLFKLQSASCAETMLCMAGRCLVGAGGGSLHCKAMTNADLFELSIRDRLCSGERSMAG